MVGYEDGLDGILSFYLDDSRNGDERSCAAAYPTRLSFWGLERERTRSFAPPLSLRACFDSACPRVYTISAFLFPSYSSIDRRPSDAPPTYLYVGTCRLSERVVNPLCMDGVNRSYTSPASSLNTYPPASRSACSICTSVVSHE